jgi:hypothetical protein
MGYRGGGGIIKSPSDYAARSHLIRNLHMSKCPWEFLFLLYLILVEITSVNIFIFLAQATVCDRTPKESAFAGLLVS